MAQINPPRRLSDAPRETATRPDTPEYGDAPGFPTNRGQEFFEDHRTAILGAIGGLVALAVLVFGWRAYQNNRSSEGQVFLGEILIEYEAGNYETALNGTDTTPGLLEIADEYGSTATGEQATFFAADALYQLGRTDDALEMFEDYDGSGLMAASALAGQAAIAEQSGDAARAAGLYERAASAFESPASTPAYLLDAARAFAAAGETEDAQDALQRVIDDWDETPEAQTAQTELGRVLAAATATGDATGAVRATITTAADSTATEDVTDGQ